MLQRLDRFEEVEYVVDGFICEKVEVGLFEEV